MVAELSSILSFEQGKDHLYTPFISLIPLSFLKLSLEIEARQGRKFLIYIDRYEEAK